MPTSLLTRTLTSLLALILVSGCSGPIIADGVKRSTVAPASTSAPDATLEPAATPILASTRLPEPTAAQPEAAPAPKPPRGTWGLETGNDVRPEAAEALLTLLNSTGMKAEPVSGEPDLRLSAEQVADSKLSWERVLVPVDRMSSVLTGITLQELRDVWTGANTSQNFATIYPDEAIVPTLDALLGAHGPAVKPQPKTALADAVWGDRMGLGIVPFEDLNVRLRAIPVDGNSPTDNRFRATDWPLTARSLAFSRHPARGERDGRAGGISAPYQP